MEIYDGAPDDKDSNEHVAFHGLDDVDEELFEDEVHEDPFEVVNTQHSERHLQVIDREAQRLAVVTTFRDNLSRMRQQITENGNSRIKSGIGSSHLLVRAGVIGKKLTPSLFQGGNVFSRALARCGDRFSYIEMRLKPIDEAMVDLSASIDAAVSGLQDDLNLARGFREQFINAIGELSHIKDSLEAEMEHTKSIAATLSKAIEESDLPHTDPSVVESRQQLSALMQKAVKLDADMKNCEDSILLLESEADANDQAISVDISGQIASLRRTQEALHTTIFKLKTTALQQRMLTRSELNDAVHALNNQLMTLAVAQETKLSVRLSETADRSAWNHKTLEKILTIRGEADKARQKNIERDRLERVKSRKALSKLALAHDVGSSITSEERRTIEEKRKHLAAIARGAAPDTPSHSD